MERELFRSIKAALRRLGRRRRNRRYRYTDATVVEVYYWSVINDRPVDWACRPENWPRALRRGPLPSQSDMSRRLRTKSVNALIERLEHLVIPQPRTPSLVRVIDGKALPIARHSRDRQAGFGRATGCLGKGYKLHAIVDLSMRLLSWRVAPMNGDERTIGRRMVRDLPTGGYLLGDASYDSNPLHQAAGDVEIQLVAPRPVRGEANNLAHGRHHPGRVRSRDMLENKVFSFGQDLLLLRRCIERFFGTLCRTGGGLTHLPPWVRTYRRVRLWVQAKLILNQLRANHRAARRKAAKSAD